MMAHLLWLTLIAAGLGATPFSISSAHTPFTLASKPAPNGAVININQASAKELTKLQGVGHKRANDIVAYRSAHGHFRGAQDLTKVPGISSKTVQRWLKDNPNRLKF